jgi:hypothetical protein
MKRLILGAAIVVAAFGAGGVAYAATDDPAPEQGYVTVEDDCPAKSSGENPAGNA